MASAIPRSAWRKLMAIGCLLEMRSCRICLDSEVASANAAARPHSIKFGLLAASLLMVGTRFSGWLHFAIASIFVSTGNIRNRSLRARRDLWSACFLEETKECLQNRDCCMDWPEVHW